MRVAGLVAAAGRSSRMGRPKALLPLEGETFAGRLLRVFAEAGLELRILTLPEPPEGGAVAVALGGSPAAHLTPNRWPDLGLGGSVRTALAVLDEEAGPESVDGLVLCPVDAPFVEPALVRALAEEVAAGAPAAVPVVGERWGHPVAFGRSSFRALDRAAVARGARTVLEALGDSVIEVPVEDARLLENINTPAQYARLVGDGPAAG